MAIGLLIALRLALRRSEPPQTAPEPKALLDALARLDTRHAGGEAQVSAQEWAEYQRERARLKAEVARQLAGKKPPA
jgi:hypothetical protein